MTKHVPTFTLSRVNLQDIVLRYHRGEFNREPPMWPKFAFNLQTKNILTENFTSSNTNDPIYTIIDRTGNKIIVATSGHENSNYFDKNNELPKGGICDYCKCQFDHTILGCPIKCKEHVYLVRQEGLEPIYRSFYIFYVDGCFCSFECILTFLNGQTARSCSFRENMFIESHKYLHHMYRLMFPKNKEPLRPLGPPALLKSNGGSLTEEMYRDTRHHYQRTNRVVLAPVKTEYVRGLTVA